MRGWIEPAQPWHVEVIADYARQADIAELWSQARVTPVEALRTCLRMGGEAKVGMIDHAPVCMFGVTPYSILRGHGTPWMVGTRALDVLSVQKHLLELSALEFAVMREQYNFLFNMVDDRNEASKRWLQWLGFTLLEPIMYGPDRVSFRQFYWERKCSSH